jgi:signal transduction histidine kinase
VSDNLAFLQDAVANVLPLLDAFEPLLALAAKASVQQETADVVERCRALLRNADLDYIRTEIPLAIQQSRDGIAQIKKIVLAMKEFSHPGVEEKEPVDVNRAIEATVMVARNEWKYVADIDLSLDRSLPPIDAIPSSLNQVILNLVVNAAHAIEEGRRDDAKGRVKIATRRRDDSVEILVTDTGCGIPPAVLDRIFDPFFTTKKVGKGTGQGLAIVRRVVVDRHGGSIEVESTVGKGTTFKLRLPIVAAEHAKERRTA